MEGAQAAEMSPPIPCLGGSREPRNPRPLPQVCVRCNAYRDRKRRTRRRGGRSYWLGPRVIRRQFRARAWHAVAWEKSALWFGCLPAIAWSPCPQL